MRAARQILDSDRFSPWHLGELACAVATVELANNKLKTARRLLRKALTDPTDNALAQAEWSGRHGLYVVEPRQLLAPLGFEARARHAVREAEWDKATDDALLWLADQPFALDAARLAGSAANTAENHVAAVEAGKVGLLANPGSAALLNSSAFAFANLGQLDRATDALDAVDLSGEDETQKAVITATRGLIAFRRGDFDSGRRLYRDAISTFKRVPRRDYVALALLFLAREELRTTPDGAEPTVRAALDAASRSSLPDVTTWARRLQLEQAILGAHTRRPLQSDR